MRVYVFGNIDIDEDKNAVLAAKFLREKMSSFTNVSADKPEIDFKLMGIDDEVKFETDHPIILDVVEGITEVMLFDDIDKVVLPPRVSAHDMDLGFQLKYLKKIGKIKKAMIIGVPMKGKIDYDRIHLILRKLAGEEK